VEIGSTQMSSERVFRLLLERMRACQ